MAAKKRFEGTVVSEKMNKTVVVEVTRVKRHRKYKKQYAVASRYKAHDENREYHLGDVVEIEASKPISRDKRWVVVRKVK